MMRKFVYKKILSIVLILALCLQLLPAAKLTVFAEEVSGETEIESETVQTVSEIEDQQTEKVEDDTEDETADKTTDKTETESTVENSEETKNDSGPGNKEENQQESNEDVTDDNEQETVAETAEEMTDESAEEESMSVETLENEIAVSNIWSIIENNGGPKTPYAFGPEVTYGDGENAVGSMELLKTWLNSYHTSVSQITWSPDGSNLTAMPLDNGAQLILLSATDPQVYQTTNFQTGTLTGVISLTGKAGDSTLTFQGLGSKDTPFRGTFENSSFTINRTLFNVLDYTTASFSGDTITVDWEGENSTGAIVASDMTSAEGKTLTAVINSSKNRPFRDAAFGNISGDLSLTISFANNTAFENKVINNPNNAGMVANTVSNGTLSLSVNSFPSSVTIGIDTSGTEKSNAGLLVGYLKNASLTLSGDMTLPIAVVQAPQGAAGGIIGRVNTNSLSSINLNGNINLTNVTILGKYSGGIAGYANDVVFNFGENSDKTFILPASLGEKANNIIGSGDVSSQYTGGIFGKYSLSKVGAYDIYNGTGFSYPSSDAPIILHVNTDSGNAGALFGNMILGEGRSFSVNGTMENSLEVSCKITVADTTVTAAGSLIGKLEGRSKANELIVSCTNAFIYVENSDKIKYLGGLVGSVEKASLNVKNVSVTAPQPSATTYFGGLTGSLAENCVLKTESEVVVSTTVSTTPAAITKGGGLVGEAKSGSIVRLSGTTDLTNVAYTAGSTVGQLVGNQNSALIFATGSGNKDDSNWIYKRSKNQSRVDDIGNYGQVIRLGGELSHDLIQIGDDNSVTFKDHRDYGSIGSSDDFALHAIAFSTYDVFKLYTDDGDSKGTLWQKNVTLASSIDLSGTGIQGLMRDNYKSGSTTEPFFAGNKNNQNGITFDGGNYTLIINTGEIYGMRGNNIADGEGSGQCYRHGCYGMLGTANSTIVKDLTIKTTMNIGADVATYAGFVIGIITGGNKDNTIENALTNVNVTNDSQINIDGIPPKDIVANVGGFIGYVEGAKTDIKVNDSSMNASINYTAETTLKPTGTSDLVVIGGIIGRNYYDQRIALNFENVIINGNISSSSDKNAHVGGLIADIVPKSNGTAEMVIKNVVITSKISNNATVSSGGLLGYYWNNVVVTFAGNESNYAVTTYVSESGLIKKASLTTAGGAAGGLCFAATGKWNMHSKAVDMSKADIDTKDGALGLLVCHGERQSGTPGEYSDADNAKALYLVMDTEWEQAYKNKEVKVSENPAVFDEIVAYTAKKNGGTYDITLSDAGIISLHTKEEKVNMTSGERNTYVNRTGYGSSHQTNSYSRYYYNLDSLSSTTPEGDVDTSEELLIWSVSKYCAENILKYLPSISSNTISGTLDMDGYSYYPVDISNTDVEVKKATITFYNQEIETKENGIKSTRASVVSQRTQHFTMHSGLLHNYFTDSNAGKSATLTVNDLTLLGTVGMVGTSSGALICGKIYGYNGTTPVKLEMNKLNVDSVEKHLSVADYNADYAPLLIDSAGSFSTLNINGVTVKQTTAGATSLIGNVGDANDANTQAINLSFSQMILPDKAGRFTKATMLHSLYYKTQNNSAVYNFTKEEDWNGTDHIYNVTYGKEIGGTVEYADSASNPHQYHYAQSEENVSHTGNKFSGEDRDTFSEYLPYVATAYSAESGYHELQVNSSLQDIEKGCGTYGDPYQISKPAELQSIAIFLATGQASKNWTLNIAVPDGTNGNSAFCSGNETDITHVTYVYDGSQWFGKDDETQTLTNDTVLTYMRNAYYMITGNIEVTNFTGFGTRANPFRGVIIGKNGTETITLKGKLPQGFIVCSYGSVVKNLKLDIVGTTTVSFIKIQNNSGYTSESYYGGVIGCVLGGDNIIDSVSVSYEDTETDNVTLEDSKSYLIPVGGYVGVISGGGVIFRGENTLNGFPCSYITNDGYFYANSYVGRVLQGFAVQEGDKVLNNSDKNYQICQLNTDESGIVVDTNSNTIQLKDAQALFVFSSVTNSGGAGGGQLLSYFSTARTWWNDKIFNAASVGGKVRNASYNKVGNVTVDNDADYQLSLKDDYKAVSAENTSYLDTHYAGGKLYNVCGDTAYSITLTNSVYDMTNYGNGYRSISPRYLANAVCSSATASTVGDNYKCLNPLISGINGNNARIKTNITVKEYVDDDHHAIAVGGVFNTVRFISNADIKNITIGGDNKEAESIISHEYYEWTNTNCNDATHKNWGKSTQGFTNLNYAQGRGLIAIGGFAGNSAADSGNRDVEFNQINTQYLYIKGPFDAGGIIGHTGLSVTGTQADSNANDKNYHICYLIGTSQPSIVPAFNNCSYQNLRIDGGMMVGGYIGVATQGLYAPPNGKKRVTGEIKITFSISNQKLGADSSIICQRPKTDDGIDKVPSLEGGILKCLPATGGVIGCSSFSLAINNTERTTIENVEVRSSRSAGGVIAWPFSNVTIKNLSIIGSEDKNQIGDLLEYGTTSYDNNKVCEFSGGLVGYFEADSYSLVVENSTVENFLIVASLRTSYPCYSGGIAGNIKGSGDHVIASCKVKNLKLANDTCADITKQNSYDGGLVGRLQQGKLYGSNLLIDSIESVKKGTKDQHGNLLGGAESGLTVYLAGVSIQNTKNLDSLLQTDIGGTKPVKCYVAYADYSGMAQDSENQGNISPTTVEPYVVTSPKGVEIPVSAADANGNKQTIYLYGDGADPEIVKAIYDEKENTDNKKFYYALTNTCSFDAKYSSDFYSEMGLNEETAGGIPNFPVLQVPVAYKDTVSAEIVSYLNLVTNNGYSTARDINVGASGHINCSIDLYRWNEGGYFEKNPDGAAKAFSGSGADFETSFTNYDSGKNQFELLTVTFTEQTYTYKIQIPIVVRRMLEVDFTATLKDSPSFKKSDYEVYNSDGFKSNITVGYGTSVSALLTYTYNSSIGEVQTYGWQTYLDNGGFMGNPEQTIQFYNPISKLKSLPEGTQLVLLDCADNNKAYKYEVSGQSELTGTNIPLSKFVDSSGSPYPSHWLSEIMEVTAAQSNSGEWVLLEGSTGATARIRSDNEYQYFRPKTKDDTDTSKLYHLTAAEIQPTEQFYLVIYIPNSSVEGIPETSGAEGKNLNGYISSSLPGLTSKVACNINAVRVKSDGSVVTDSHSSSESTYNFLSGYAQSLSDNSQDKDQKLESDPEAYILLSEPENDGSYLLHMDLIDEITVVKGQKDTAETPLFFKENVSLPNYAKAENDSVSLVTANGFPTGCYGTVEFYVYTSVGENRTYYKWNGSKWVSAGDNEKALSYEWDSDGRNMELYLGTNNTKENAVSLAAIRQLAKDGNAKFYVETKIDIHMSVPAAEQVIAGSITKGNAYTKLSYTTYLASDTGSFSSTNYVESKAGKVRYYQSRSGSSTITHSANDPTQLGINCSDLASANGVIYTTGVYDLTTVSNAENLIRDANKVTYTLTLWQRQEDGSYAQITDNLDKYIRSVRMKDEPIPYSNGYQWTDIKSDGNFASADPENSKRFFLPIRVQVNTDVETNGVTFANYQLRLTAVLHKDAEVLDNPVNKEIQVGGNTEYVRYDYVTYTITRLLTSGYWGEEN